MNKSQEQGDKSKGKKGLLERIAHAIDPGREVSDDELIDPGASTATGKVVDNRSGDMPDEGRNLRKKK